jgi:hypothetical protein
MVCIVCRNEFESAPPEHFIPEHIGGKDTIDCVCDSCNHGYLAKIDGRIRNNTQLSMAIDSTTRPRYAEILHEGGSVKRKVRILDGTKNKLKFSAQGPDGPIPSTGIRISLKPEDDLALNKVFAKILFGTIAFKFGCQEALSPKYDVFRTYLTSSFEDIPNGLSVKLVAATVSGNSITELVSFDHLSNQVISNKFEVKCVSDLSHGNIVLAENAEGTTDALVILLGGKKSGRLSFQGPILQRFIYF